MHRCRTWRASPSSWALPLAFRRPPRTRAGRTCSSTWSPPRLRSSGPWSPPSAAPSPPPTRATTPPSCPPRTRSGRTCSSTWSPPRLRSSGPWSPPSAALSPPRANEPALRLKPGRPPSLFTEWGPARRTSVRRPLAPPRQPALEAVLVANHPRAGQRLHEPFAGALHDFAHVRGRQAEGHRDVRVALLLDEGQPRTGPKLWRQ